ncbi:MAG: hypothetical protein IJM42_01190 [Synergistes sp.]|nr:hypothetical protein [Synergistes sp.]
MMLEKTYRSSGKNSFENNNFSSPEWYAAAMVSPEEIKERIASFKLEGRTIQKLRMIGLSYMLTRDWIKSHAYDLLGRYEEEERQKRSDYHNIDPEAPFGRYSQIDEPFLICFEDGDVFEIDTPQEPEFCMSMNCIPWETEADTNLPNVDANVLFAPCIGKTISNVEVRTYYTDRYPFSSDFFEEEHSKREYVSDIVLWLDDGNGISIGGYYDYCQVAYIDENRTLLTIPFAELKSGMFNWEDLHTDEITGFEARSPSLFFGETGRRHAAEPYITLSPGEGKTHLYISCCKDFLLLDQSIACLSRESFDRYKKYELSFLQWKKVLDIAEKIVSFTSFDDLFDYLAGFGIICKSRCGVENNPFPERLNSNGAELWNDREKYVTQLEDIREWTKLVLSENESMMVYGF